MTTHHRTLKLSTPVYERLGKPPAVDLVFLGHDLLVCAGKTYKVGSLSIRAPGRKALIKPGAFTDDIQLMCGRWTCIVRDCAYHFYLEHTPYDGSH